VFLRKATTSPGCSQRCSSACISCASLCDRSAGQCNKIYSGVPSVFWQKVQLASAASPMRCLYVGSDVWWPQRNRARCSRSSRGRCCSNAGSMEGERFPSGELGWALLNDLCVYVGAE